MMAGMAVDMTSNPNGLARRLARIGKQYSLYRTWLTTTNPKDTGDFDSLMDQYAGDRSFGPELVNIHLDALANVIATQERYRQTARQTLIRQVMKEADNPPPRPDLRLCLVALLDELRAAGTDVNAQVATLGLETYGSNVGDGLAVWTATRPDGQAGEHIFGETLRALCTRDSYSGHMGTGAGTSLAGSEEWSVRGFPGVSNTMDPDWGGATFGSGADGRFTTVNPNLDNTLGQRLVNGDMADWTGATPDHWAKTDASSQISQTTTSGEYYDGTSGLKIAGHATGAPLFYQEFNAASGSSYLMKPFTNYALSFWAKVSAVPLTGILTARLVDGGNTALTSEYDANGYSASPTSQTADFAMTGWTTSFVHKSATFRLKRGLPATVRLLFQVNNGGSAPLEAGTNAFLDRFTLTEMSSIVPSLPWLGPWGAFVGGLANFAYKDSYTLVVTNDRGGATNLNSFQTLLLRMFPEMVEWGLMFPSDSGGTEALADSLITA